MQLSKLLVLAFLMMQFSTTKLLAFSAEEFNMDYEEEDISSDIKPLKVTGDAIKWEIFAKTIEKSECTIDEDGFDNCLVRPIYSPQIKALHNKEVTLTGFMFPLDSSAKQQNFLIGPYPTSCPFHYHVKTSQIVEVNLKKPIDFSFDPVTVKGVLSLKYNEETGIFYYLSN